jgi:hypothetical protein
VAVLSLAALPGCRSAAASKQRCLAGDLSACESACAKGVAGEGGCFHAGNAHRERGALDFSGSEWRRGLDYFRKSCKGGYGDGCLLAAQMIEAPYAAPEAAPGGTPKAISDAELGDRESLLAASCKLGSAQGCKRLGDVLIGKNTPRARSAYEESCRTSAERDACKAARVHETDVAERWRSACTRGVADDCTRLGNLLYAVDVPRAVRLFESECALRGVESAAGGVGAFVEERVREARGGIVDDRAPPAPADVSASAPSLTFKVPEVHGELAIIEVDRVVRRHAGDIAGCFVGANLPSQTVLAKLTVDRTGDVWRAEIAPSTPDPALARVAACLTKVFEGLTFLPPASGLATVDLTFEAKAPPAKP